MSFMRKIRNNRSAVKIPMIILVVALTVGLVAAFTQWSVPNAGSGSQTVQNQTNGGNDSSGKLDDIRRFEQIIKSNPDNLQVLKDLANAQYDAGVDYYFNRQDHGQGERLMQQAVSNYQTILEKEPDNVFVRTDLATLAYYLGQKELAKEHFEKAISQDPTFENARNNYGEFLLDAMDNPEGAIAQWQALLDLNPEPGRRATLEDKIATARKK